MAPEQNPVKDTVDGAPIPRDQPLVIGSHEFGSRLFLGTGKYPDLQVMQQALEVSGTQCVTVAVRRMQLGVPEGKTLCDYLDRDRYVLLPNTAGCFTAEDAVRTAMLGREAGMSDIVKLEVLGDTDTLLPDPVGTLEAAAASPIEARRKGSTSWRNRSHRIAASSDYSSES